MSTETQPQKTFDLYKLLSFIAAFLALIGFAIFMSFLLTKTTLPDWQWLRLLDLFGSVEAIVFAAAGFLFGREVNRQRANSAEKTAEQKEKEAALAKEKEAAAKKKAENEEKKALQLKTAIETYSANNKNSFGRVSANVKGISDNDAVKSLFMESANSDFLVDFANRLFEDHSQTQLLTFNWKVSPANKIRSITIGGETFRTDHGSCTALAAPGHKVRVIVETVTGHDQWTFTMSKILDEYGNPRKQAGGPTTSSATSETIETE